MPFGRGGRSEAREQLVPKERDETTSSSSPVQRVSQCDVPLPGTIPSQPHSIDAPAATVLTTNGPANGDASYKDLADAQYIAAPGSPSGAEPPPGYSPAPGSAAAAQLSPAMSPSSSARLPVASGGGSSVVAAMEIQEALLPPQPAPPFQHPIPIGQRRWMVVMFCLVAALLFADQNLLAPNLTAAAEYFGMNEQQKDTLLGGALMAAFFAVGAPAALLVGWLTDRGDINRRTLLFWVVVVGETPCLLTYWVTAFWQFFLLRALTGVAVGGCFPLVFSLLGDLFPPQRRAAVSAVVQIATGIGLAAGQALSGSIGPATNWRVPFVVVAAPSLAVAVVMLCTTREPPRGAYEEALRERYAEGLGAYEGSISWAKVAVLLRCPSNALVILQGLPGSLPWGMMLTYFNDFLSQQKGFTVQAATLVLLMFGGGGALGVIGGGAGGQWLYNRRKEYQALLAGACVLAGIGPLYALINADLQRIGLGATCVLAALGGAVASVAGPNLRSVMLNVNEPETRGVALALQSMTDDLGKGLGPVLVAGLIHALGREDAFNVATAGWIPCGVMLASLAFCMRRDEEAMQARLSKSSEQQAAAAEAAAVAGGGGGGDGAGGVGSGVSLPMPPLSPSSDGGASSASPLPQAAAAATSMYSSSSSSAAVATARREERRLAKVRLLGYSELAETSSSSTWGPPRGPDGATARAGGGAGRGGDGASVRLPLSSSAPEIDEDPGARPWAARSGYAAPPLASAAAAAAVPPAPTPSYGSDRFCSGGMEGVGNGRVGGAGPGVRPPPAPLQQHHHQQQQGQQPIPLPLLNASTQPQPRSFPGQPDDPHALPAALLYAGATQGPGSANGGPAAVLAIAETPLEAGQAMTEPTNGPAAVGWGAVGLAGEPLPHAAAAAAAQQSGLGAGPREDLAREGPAEGLTAERAGAGASAGAGTHGAVGLSGLGGRDVVGSLAGRSLHDDGGGADASGRPGCDADLDGSTFTPPAAAAGRRDQQGTSRVAAGPADPGGVATG